jgi:integrase
MSYAQRNSKGKLTGKFFGETVYRGKKFRRLCDSKSEADGYEGYVKATGEEPAHKDGARHTGVTFREVAELCKEAGGPRRGRWKAERDPSVMQRLDHVVAVLGDLDIASVGTIELDRLVADLQRRPGYQGRALSPSTINRYLTAASAVLTFASARGYIQGKPVVPLQEEDGAREAVVSPAIESALWAWLTEHGHHAERLCFQVLIETGMRAGELQAIEPSQIENEWITLRANQVKTKTRRMVWIDPARARDLRALIASGQRPNGARLRTIFKRAAKAVGDSGELVIHSLRHTRATRLLEAGVDPQVCMEMLGWTSFNTMTRYRHVKPAMHVEAAKKVALQRGDLAENGSVLAFEPRRTA